MTDVNTVNRDKLMADLQTVIADAEALLRMTAEDASEGAADIRSRILARMEQARVELLQAQDAVIAKARAAGLATDEFVQENPWKSVGIAAGIGLLIGLLISRR